jgi:ATP-binding cassette subfamily F protein uup
LGRNGSGKTTFLKMLVGELEPDMGTVKRARDLQLSYFDQARKDLRPEWSLWRNLLPNGGDYIDVMGSTRHVCGYLKDFLFDPMQATQAVGVAFRRAKKQAYAGQGAGQPRQPPYSGRAYQ